MIAKAHPGPGSRLRKLLQELYGPGTSRYEQRTGPHLIAAWDPFEADPATGAATIGELAAHFDRYAGTYGTARR
ncbi:hypothetical protein [Spongiactinospora sp. 9N601]|uniref:hypothetical protein n=1 Tax=Spongiactinospora sp. 9N601 TaxID=3375149 RepID=UPI0037941FE5